MNATGWSRGLDVTGGGTGIVSHAGLVLLRQLSDRTGLTAGLPAALPSPLGGHDADILELIPVTIPELLRQLRGAVIPSPAATRPTATAGRSGDAATSITRGKPTSAGTPTPTSCPDNDLQLP